MGVSLEKVDHISIRESTRVDVSSPLLVVVLTQFVTLRLQLGGCVVAGVGVVAAGTKSFRGVLQHQGHEPDVGDLFPGVQVGGVHEDAVSEFHEGVEGGVFGGSGGGHGFGVGVWFGC